MKKRLISIIASVIMMVTVMCETVFASYATDTRTVAKSSSTYSVTMGVTVSAIASFTDDTMTSSTGKSISLTFTNKNHVTDISESGNRDITSGSQATVKKSFTLYYNYNSHRYYTGAVVEGVCYVGTSGQRSPSCIIGTLNNIGKVY